jgi:catechol 2,3-dioxygenase-like lactoylglutathione lyase family enzyme
MKHPLIDSQITFLYTNDLDNTARFYEELVGLELVLDQGSCRIYRISRESYIGFCSKSNEIKEISSVILTFVTPKVDEWYEFLKSRGVVFEKQPELNPKFKIYHAMLRDPNGYLIEIQKFVDPRWK